MDFMVAKNALNKKIQEAMQEATGPKSLKQRFSGAVEKLSQELLDELQKQVDPSAHDKLINALKDLSTQLQGRWAHGDRHHRSEHHHHHEGWMPSIACLNRSATRCAKSNSPNDTYAQGLRRA